MALRKKELLAVNHPLRAWRDRYHLTLKQVSLLLALYTGFDASPQHLGDIEKVKRWPGAGLAQGLIKLVQENARVYGRRCPEREPRRFGLDVATLVTYGRTAR